MPTLPARVCGTCGQTGCQQHRRSAWTHVHETPRIRGRKLQRLRAQLFTQHPLCVECSQHGRTSMATIRDHIIPLAEGGRDDAANTQAICQSCSDEKTRQESMRGVKRWR